MIAKIAFVFALVGAAVAAPASRVELGGILPTGAGFAAKGKTASGAAADKDSGVAAGGVDGIGSVIGAAGPGFATGIAFASPSL